MTTNRAWLHASILLSDQTYNYDNNKKLNRMCAKKYLGTSIPETKNDFSSRQRYNGQRGTFKVSSDTSVKLPPTIYIYIHTHTYIYTHTHTHTHTHTCTHTHTRTHAHTHT